MECKKKGIVTQRHRAAVFPGPATMKLEICSLELHDDQHIARVFSHTSRALHQSLSPIATPLRATPSATSSWCELTPPDVYHHGKQVISLPHTQPVGSSRSRDYIRVDRDHVNFQDDSSLFTPSAYRSRRLP